MNTQIDLMDGVLDPAHAIEPIMADPTSKEPPAALHEELIRAAILAPTPDNNQPWRFESHGKRLGIYIDPSRTLPSDVNRMFDLLGIGAAIENVCIAARQQGLETHVELPPEPKTCDGFDLAATLTFELHSQPDPLFPHLASRCTNRKLYAKTAPDEATLQRLSEATSQFGATQVDWIVDRNQIKSMASLIAATDLIRFQYEPFHQELFRQLRFSAEEADRTRDGLDLRTLELPPGVGLALHVLKSWTVMNWLHRLGVGRLLTLPSIAAIRRSGVLAVISTSEPNAECFLEGGRAFERLWLQADKEGLALQPLGSPSIFFAHLEVLGGERLTDKHKRRVKTQLIKMQELLPSTRGRTIVIAARLGQALPPSFRSLRRSANSVLYLRG